MKSTPDKGVSPLNRILYLLCNFLYTQKNRCYIIIKINIKLIDIKVNIKKVIGCIPNLHIY